MARFGNSEEKRILLDERSVKGGGVQYFAAPIRRPVKTDRKTAKPQNHLMLEWSPALESVTTSPLNTLEGTPRFFDPKYEKLHRISFEQIDDGDTFYVKEFLESLPAGFVKDPQYGLGLLKDGNRIVKLIEEHTSCSELVLVPGTEIEVSGSVFRIGLDTWDLIWREINRINSRGSSAAARVKDAFVNNELADSLGIPEVTPSLGRLTVSNILTKAANGVEVYSEEEQKTLMSAVKTQALSVAEAAPESVVALQRDLELVNLDRLIERFEEDLEKNRMESHWQEFFDKNIFALQQIFGSPAVHVASGASVGGTKLDGSGNKIADYLMKNLLTSNVALVEIKRPSTKIMRRTPYRNGVYGVEPELVEAITQVLDQAHQLSLQFNNLKINSRENNLEAYNIRCFLIVGRLPAQEELDKMKSFELFRGNSLNVTIVTFDEVLASIRSLRDYLASNDV